MTPAPAQDASARAVNDGRRSGTTGTSLGADVVALPGDDGDMSFGAGEDASPEYSRDGACGWRHNGVHATDHQWTIVRAPANVRNALIAASLALARSPSSHLDTGMSLTHDTKAMTARKTIEVNLVERDGKRNLKECLDLVDGDVPRIGEVLIMPERDGYIMGMAAAYRVVDVERLYYRSPDDSWDPNVAPARYLKSVVHVRALTSLEYFDKPV